MISKQSRFQIDKLFITQSLKKPNTTSLLQSHHTPPRRKNISVEIAPRQELAKGKQNDVTSTHGPGAPVSTSRARVVYSNFFE
jgi:hypothetical protein